MDVCTGALIDKVTTLLETLQLASSLHLSTVKFIFLFEVLVVATFEDI